MTLHYSITKTVEEIDEQLRRGKAFSEKHPMSAFGDDNEKSFRLVERILNKVKEGASMDKLEDYISLLGDEEYMTASDAISWLSGDEDYDIYSEMDVKDIEI